MGGRHGRTWGMGVNAVFAILYGAVHAVGNTWEVARGRTFDGQEVDPLMAALGLGGAFFGAILAAGGAGTWLVRPLGRTLSLVAALGMIAVNAVATMAFDFPSHYFMIGAIYPVVVLFLFSTGRWKAAFRSDRGHAPPPGATRAGPAA